MSADKIGVDEGNVTDGASFVNDRLRRGPRTRPIQICHHFYAQLFQQHQRKIMEQLLLTFASYRRSKFKFPFILTQHNFKCQNSKNGSKLFLCHCRFNMNVYRIFLRSFDLCCHTGFKNRRPVHHFQPLSYKIVISQKDFFEKFLFLFISYVFVC